MSGLMADSFIGKTGPSILVVVLDQREDVEALQFPAAVEEGQLDRKGSAVDDSAELLH